mgnify:CR=1 FL=1
MSSERLSICGDEIVAPKDCVFCLMNGDEGTTQYRDHYGLNQVVELNLPATFTAIHDVAPMGENVAHLLLVPKRDAARHYVSLAIVQDQVGLTSSRDIIIGAYKKLSPENPIFFFEHGPGIVEGEAVACGGCTVDHAHGHVVMLPKGTTMDPVKAMAESILNVGGWQSVSSRGIETVEIFSNLFDVAGINPYLHIGIVETDGSSRAITYIQKTRSETVPSQLMRRVLSESIYDRQDPSYWHYRDIMDGFVPPERVEQLKAEVLDFRRKIGKSS